MTVQTDAARKGRLYALLGIGIAGLLGAYQVATRTPPEGTSSLTVPVIFVVISIICFTLAARMVLKLSKES